MIILVKLQDFALKMQKIAENSLKKLSFIAKAVRKTSDADNKNCNPSYNNTKI